MLTYDVAAICIMWAIYVSCIVFLNQTSDFAGLRFSDDVSTWQAKVLSPLRSLRVMNEMDFVPLACQDDYVHVVIVKVCTVLPDNSDSDAMLCLHRYQRLRIDRSLVY